MSSSTPQGKSGLDGFDGPPFSHDFHILRLPKPTAKPKPNEPPPFKPVPVLNELHEPPPSAGLFPPITPNLLHDDTGKPLSNTLFSIQPERGAPKDTQGGEEASSRDAPSSTAGTAGTAEDDKDSKQKAKRICLRGRLKWTEEETEDLMKGVAVYGVGKWKKILVHPDLYFHPDRTMVDLKDRYRTCRMNEEKAIERQAMGKRPAGKAELRNRRNSSRIELPNLLVPERSKSSSPAPPPPPPAPSLPPILPPLPPPTASNAEQISPTSSEKECCFEITTPNLYYQEQNPSSPKGKKAPAVQPWSEEEDAALSKGYQKYGFQWTAIAKDADFCLGRRSGAQVRDRFRLKYPIVYQSSIPLPLPETQKRAPRKKGSRRRLSVASKDGADHAHQNNNNNNNNNKPPGHRQQPSKSSAAAAETSFIAHDPEPLAADKSGRMTYRMFDPTKESQPEQEAWSHHQHQHHPHQGHRHRRWSGVDAQPLPDPDPEGEGELIPMASTPPTSPPSTAALRSRQASMEADDARHLHQHQHQSLHHHHHYTHPNHHQQHQHQHQHHQHQQHQQHQHMMGSSIFDLLNVDESEHDNENENEHEHGHDDEREHENEHEGEEQQVVAGGGGGGSGGGSGGGGSRLPPFKYTFDDDDINEWAANSQGGGGGGGGGGSGGGGGGGSGVTLPPLLWEDLASRPIFELE